MPRPVADQFQVALGLSHRPATLGEWVDLTARRLDAADVEVGIEQLCVTDDAPHRVRLDGETYHFACVLDTVLLPFVIDHPGTVTVRTRSPERGTVIEAEVSTDHVTVDPSGAVMSLGIGRARPDRENGPLDGADAAVCPYINAFVDEAAYRRWASEADDAETMAVPFERGFQLAGALADALDPA